MAKISIVMAACLVRALETRYVVPKLQNALDAAYNDASDVVKDALRVVEETTGIKAAAAKESKAEGIDGRFTATDGTTTKREGKLNDPRRFIVWNTNFNKFVKTNGEPSGEITPEILPANLVFWLETKFLKDELKPVRVPGSNGNLQGKAKGNKRNGITGVAPAGQPA